MNRQVFTRIKLMGVSGVIAILAVFLLPSYAKAQKNTGSSDQAASPQETQVQRDYFYEVHMENEWVNSEMFGELENLVKLANKYKIKLTLLFTPQWAEMILTDSQKMAILNRWKSQGHEIGGHHHGPGIVSWDRYSALSMEEIDRIRASLPQNQRKISQERMGPEKYRGNMADYMKLLNRLAGKQIAVITMSNENQDWPAGVPYAAGGNFLEEAISTPKNVVFNGHEVTKVTAAALLAKPGKRTGQQTTVGQLKEKFLSSKLGIFGVVSHEMDYKDNPKIYGEWFNFLNSIDSSGKHSYTISEIIKKHF